MLKNHKKRVRSTNFSVEEEETLLKCVLLRKEIIECKKTDALTTNSKKLAWDQVSTDFNSRWPNITRTPKALRDKYNNVKKTLRKQFAAKGTSRHVEGGGKHSSEWQQRNLVMTELARTLELPNSETAPHCDDDDNSYDGTSAEISDEVDSKVELLVPKVVSSDNEGVVLNNSKTPPTIANQPLKNDWSDYTTAMAEQLVSDPLKASPLPQEMTSNEKGSLQELKKKKLNKEMEMREEEHKAQMELFSAQMAELRERSEFRQRKLLLLKKINIQIKKIKK